MEIKDYQIGDEFKIIELFELVFKQKMTLEQWNWRFKENPAGQFMIKLMWDGQNLIGHYAVSPIYVTFNNNRILTSHSLATMTHPDHGGKGIFKKLSLALYEKLENELGCKAIWGFPNNNSHYAFINSLSWKDISVLHTMGIKPEKLVNGINIPNIEEFDTFNQSHADYIENKLSVFAVKVERNVEYLNWRYCLKPSVKYRKFCITHENKIVGLIVTKTYKPSNSQEIFDLNLVEYHLDDYSMLPNVINKITEIYNITFDRITVWKSIFDSNHLNLEKIGFIPVLPQTYLGSRTINEISETFNDFKNWYITMGDSDVF
jgi:hypothetical protein